MGAPFCGAPGQLPTLPAPKSGPASSIRFRFPLNILKGMVKWAYRLLREEVTLNWTYIFFKLGDTTKLYHSLYKMSIKLYTLKKKCGLKKMCRPQINLVQINEEDFPLYFQYNI